MFTNNIAMNFTFILPYPLNKIKEITFTFWQNNIEIIKKFNDFSISDSSNQFVVTLTETEIEKFMNEKTINVKYTLITHIESDGIYTSETKTIIINNNDDNSSEESDEEQTIITFDGQEI